MASEDDRIAVVYLVIRLYGQALHCYIKVAFSCLRAGESCSVLDQ